jgi:hypothetical protein
LRGEVFFFLLLAAPLKQRQTIEAHVDGQNHPQAGVHVLQLFARQPQADAIHPRATELDRQANAQDTQFAQPLENPRDVFLLAVVLLDDRRDFLLGEIAYHLGDHFVFLCE